MGIRESLFEVTVAHSTLSRRVSMAHNQRRYERICERMDGEILIFR